jgi:hypothetical protein
LQANIKLLEASVAQPTNQTQTVVIATPRVPAAVTNPAIINAIQAAENILLQKEPDPTKWTIADRTEAYAKAFADKPAGTFPVQQEYEFWKARGVLKTEEILAAIAAANLSQSQKQGINPSYTAEQDAKMVQLAMNLRGELGNLGKPGIPPAHVGPHMLEALRYCHTLEDKGRNVTAERAYHTVVALAFTYDLAEKSAKGTTSFRVPNPETVKKSVFTPLEGMTFVPSESNPGYSVVTYPEASAPGAAPVNNPHAHAFRWNPRDAASRHDFGPNSGPDVAAPSIGEAPEGSQTNGVAAPEKKKGWFRGNVGDVYEKPNGSTQIDLIPALKNVPGFRPDTNGPANRNGRRFQ